MSCEKQAVGNKGKIGTDLKDQNIFIDDRTFAHSSIFIDPWQETEKTETENQQQLSISAEPSQNDWADFGKFNWKGRMNLKQCNK